MRAVYALATASVLGLSASPMLAGALEEPVVAPDPVPVAPIVPASLWEGFYAGAQLGGGWFDADGDVLDTDDNDAVGGLHAGWQGVTQNRLVYGAEVDANATGLEFDGHDLDSLSHIKAKLGYDLGRSMVYATAGGAYGEASDGLGASWGYSGGVGYDYMMTDALSLGGEIQYQKMDDFNDDTEIDGTTAAIKVSYHF
ncbi:outer membrane protein [Poseidonocella sp. HB161398]|uniref:outer membrane protein n=1 Tax=Poseidonocella sp. HB161398 TaxID=2320855 RepID=UPI001109FB94|nr:outer membrane beta-barrel protein [Poseidonocella sp. HB161398]